MLITCKDSILDMTPTDFEKHSLRILSEQLQNFDNCTFQHNKIIEVDDGNYQIDGYIKFNLMGVDYKTIVECKHYKSSISREKVAVLHDKIRSCGANKGVLISSSNFQKGAIQYATKHGIALIQLTDSENLYFTRSIFNEQKKHTKTERISLYIGVMQTGDENKVRCLNLSNNNLCLKEFLLNVII